MSSEPGRGWNGPEEGGGPPLDDAVLTAVRKRAAALDRTVRRRDMVELGAAGIALVIFLPFLAYPSWVTRAGVLVFLLGCVVLLVQMRRARRARPDPAAPLGEALRAERAAVEAQIRLLESVLWWYIAPLGTAVVLIFAGIAGLTWPSLAYATLVAVLGAWVYRLNRAAVRTRLAPAREELSRLIARLEEDGG